MFGWLSVLDNVIASLDSKGGGGGFLADLVDFPTRNRRDRARRERARETLEECGLSHIADQPAGSLPIGLARMVELARAIVDRPKVLLLDEPTSGLDTNEADHLGRTDRMHRGRPRVRRAPESSMTWTFSCASATGSWFSTWARSLPRARPRKSGPIPPFVPRTSGASLHVCSPFRLFVKSLALAECGHVADELHLANDVERLVCRSGDFMGTKPKSCSLNGAISRICRIWPLQKPSVQTTGFPPWDFNDRFYASEMALTRPDFLRSTSPFFQTPTQLCLLEQ